MDIPKKTEAADAAFPVGMKVLLVDQRVCLRILSCMLKACGYEGQLRVYCLHSINFNFFRLSFTHNVSPF
jgi:hypothetical protein